MTGGRSELEEVRSKNTVSLSLLFIFEKSFHILYFSKFLKSWYLFSHRLLYSDVHLTVGNDMTILSNEVLLRALPDKFKKNLNQELLDNINDTLSDPDLQDTFRENFLDYIDVLNDGRYKITDYLSAIKYCTHKLMGNSNIDSYTKTFPDRYSSMIVRGLSNKDMSSIITVYNKSKLVNKIMEQSLVPTWVLNQHLHQKALNVQADLMMNAASEKVRSDAANSLLTHLKPPEITKVELDIGIKDDDQLRELRDVTVQLAAQQRRMIESGVITAKAAAEQRVVTGETYEHKG